MAVVCVGQSAYDIVIPYDGELTENQKYRVRDQLECGGGPAMNAAYLCALWGEETSLISRIGDDDYGKKLKKILREAGVDTAHLVEEDGIETPYSIILSNTGNGARTIFNFPGEIRYRQYTYPRIDVSVILSDGHLPKLSIGAIENIRRHCLYWMRGPAVRVLWKSPHMWTILSVLKILPDSIQERLWIFITPDCAERYLVRFRASTGSMR